VRIRMATPADAAAMAELERDNSVNWSHKHYESLGATIPKPAGYLVLVAEDSSHATRLSASVLGYLAAHYVADDWELQYIVVAREFQRRGVATCLVNELIRQVRAHGGTHIFLEVRESNQNARALYRKLGFRETGLRKGYYPDPPEDAILYSLML